eukprot:TRINITY_DN7469_c0_g1_i2.p2 TRINITY_DN7469_c0_g1~~TRINITY_DN7469_c0_g1_i2.p2  ORF type:complete len:123 (+),score=11.03 TRINITY_DN7469_c0_g1_i2:128-496(+)
MALNASLSSLNWLTHLSSNLSATLAPKLPDEKQTHIDDVVDDSTALDVDWSQETSRKPPFAYSTLCYMALTESDKSKLELNEIYDFVTSNFAYYRAADAGWKVRPSLCIFNQLSLRHSLSFA